MTGTTQAHRAVGSTIRQPPPKRPYGLTRHRLAIAERSVIRVGRTPEGLADAVFLPIVFLAMFVYLCAVRRLRALAIRAYRRHV